MDVKFPLSKFLLLSETSQELARLKKEFLTDVRARVRELVQRNYASMEGAFEYVILFIPSEHVVAFIQGEDPSIFDEALKSKIVCTSPMGLFPILSLIRQMASQAILQQTTHEIVQILREFSDQWRKFCERQDGVGAKIQALQKEFDQMAGVRSRKLDRILDKLDHIQTQEARERISGASAQNIDL